MKFVENWGHLGMEYNAMKMEDALETIIDYRGKTPQKSTTGIKTLSAKSVKNGYIDYSQCYYISQDEYKRFMVRGFPKIGDVLLTTEAPLGLVAKLDRDDVAIAQRLLLLRGKKGVLDNDYLMYFLQSAKGQALLKARETGTTVTGIKQSEFRKIEIEIPEYEYQTKIANILKLIDKKIAVNNEINGNLLQQLLVVYENLVTTREIRETVELKTLCAFQEGYVNPPQTRHEYFDGSIKWLRAVDINESFIIETSRTLTTSGFESAKKSALLFQPNTIAITKSGTIGRIGIVADYMCGNRAVINIRPLNPIQLPLIYAYLKSKQKKFPDMAVGSVQKNLYVSLLEPLRVDLPEAELVGLFCDIGNSLLTRMQNNCKENLILANIHDALLPQLIAGRIDVSDIDI